MDKDATKSYWKERAYKNEDILADTLNMTEHTSWKTAKDKLGEEEKGGTKKKGLCVWIKTAHNRIEKKGI